MNCNKTIFETGFCSDKCKKEFEAKNEEQQKEISERTMLFVKVLKEDENIARFAQELNEQNKF